MGVAQKKVRSAQSGADGGSTAYGKPPRTWAGHGKGSRCDLCKQPIQADQIEYELELETQRRVQSIKLHFECYEQWMLLHQAMTEDPPTPDQKSS